jgi:hypothetical protein
LHGFRARPCFCSVCLASSPQIASQSTSSPCFVWHLGLCESLEEGLGWA